MTMLSRFSSLARLALPAVMASFLSLPVSAADANETPEQKGYRIAAEAELADAGWQDSRSNVKMVLRNSSGGTAERELRISALEVKDDGDKSLVIFDEPRDVSGTAFLSYSHALEADEQWLFLPALKRVKRISSSNKSGPFMGSEFAYEDMATPELKKYEYKWVGDEVIDGVDCYIVETFPQYERSGYSKRVVWMDKVRMIPIKTDFYDRKNSLLKTLTYTGYQQYLDKFWRPTEMEMVNHQTGKSTSLITSEMEFHTGLEENDFSQNALKRAR